MTNQDLTSLVVEKLELGRTVEDITVLLFMNDSFDTKAKCRVFVTEVMEDNDLVPAAKVPMSQQLKEWFHSQPDPLSLTKKDLEKQIVAIGMKGGSVQWYIRVYLEAIAVAKEIISKQ